jgi:hypothetical protein
MHYLEEEDGTGYRSLVHSTLSQRETNSGRDPLNTPQCLESSGSLFRLEYIPGKGKEEGVPYINKGRPQRRYTRHFLIIDAIPCSLLPLHVSPTFISFTTRELKVGLTLSLQKPKTLNFFQQETHI